MTLKKIKYTSRNQPWVDDTSVDPTNWNRCIVAPTWTLTSPAGTVPGIERPISSMLLLAYVVSHGKRDQLVFSPKLPKEPAGASTASTMMVEASFEWAVPRIEPSPEVGYAPDALAELRPFVPWANELILTALSVGAKNGVRIDKVNVWRFVSREASEHRKCVFNFFSGSARGELLKTFPILSQAIGEWCENQLPFVKKDFADQVSVELTPLEFWKDVRPS